MCVFLSPGWSSSSFVRGEQMWVGGEHRGLFSERQNPGQTQLYHLKAIYKKAPGKLIGIVSPSETQLSAMNNPVVEMRWCHCFPPKSLVGFGFFCRPGVLENLSPSPKHHAVWGHR